MANTPLRGKLPGLSRQTDTRDGPGWTRHPKFIPVLPRDSKTQSTLVFLSYKTQSIGKDLVSTVSGSSPAYGKALAEVMLRSFTGAVEEAPLIQWVSKRAQKHWQNPSHTYSASLLQPTLLPFPGLLQLRKQKMLGKPIKAVEFVLRELSNENLSSPFTAGCQGCHTARGCDQGRIRNQWQSSNACRQDSIPRSCGKRQAHIYSALKGFLN